MAHKHRKVARRLQRHWDVPYSTALKAAIDAHAAPDWGARYAAAKETDPDKTYKDIHFDLCVEDWGFY